MTDTLTESFCERCGTKFSFGPPPKPARLAGLRVLSRGLKNYVLTDESSLDDAMTTAREDVRRRQTTRQLESFHETFNFCVSCRQYTCTNCWNPIEAKCLSCAPMPVEAVVAEPTTYAAPELLEAPAPTISFPAFTADTAPLSTEALTSLEPEAGPAWATEAAPVDVPVDAGFVDLDARLGPAPTPARSGNGHHQADTDRPTVGRLGSWARRVTASNTSKEAAPAPSAEQPAVAPDFETLLARAELQLDEDERLKASTDGIAGALAEVEPAQLELAVVPDAEFAAEAVFAIELELQPELKAEHEVDNAAEFAIRLEPIAEFVVEPEWTVDLESEADYTADPEFEAELVAAADPVVEAESVVAAEAEYAADPEFEMEPVVAAEPVLLAETEVAAEPVVATESAQAQPEPVLAVDALMAETEVAAEPVIAVEPEFLSEPDVSVVMEPVATMATEPEFAVESGPETDFTVEPQIAVEPEVVREPVAPPVWWIVAPEADAAPRVDRVAQPTWPATPYPSVTATPSVAPMRPASPPPSNGTPWPALPLAQALGRVPATETIWAASSRDVLNRPGSGVRGCGSCGLALSAAARFCRRCGSPQDASAG